MISANEMRDLLLKEFGIKSDKELFDALDKIGGIDISLFVLRPNEIKENEK